MSFHFQESCPRLVSEIIDGLIWLSLEMVHRVVEVDLTLKVGDVRVCIFQESCDIQGTIWIEPIVVAEVLDEHACSAR